jgi:recombinase, phage RecT family
MATAAKPESTALAIVETKGVVALLESDQARAVIEPMLPQGVEYRRVMQEVYLAGKDNPEILQCTPASIIRAVAKAESWGLTIGDTVHLVPFNVKTSKRGEQDRWEKRLKAVQDYKGKIELIVSAGAARAVNAECVYQNEFFELELGTHPTIRHRPEREEAKRGAMIGAYAYADLGQRYQPIVKWMPVAEIDEIRKSHSKQWKDGPLKPWYARKTVVHQLAKVLPKNARMLKVLKAFEEEELELVDELPGAPVATVAAPSQPALASGDGSDWKLDDDEPATIEAAPAAATPASTEPTADTSLPTCPSCKGDMWDNRVGKRNPRAPDFKCKDRECEGVLWPGQWPPKAKDEEQHDLTL